MRRIVTLGLALLLGPAAFAQSVDINKWPRQAERSRDYDVLHYNLRFRFDRSAGRYFGENAVTLEPLQDGFETCRLDAEEFTVTAVTDEAGAPIVFDQTDRHLIIRLPAPRRYRERLTFTVAFEGGRQKTGLKFIEAGESHPAQINTYGWPDGNHHWFPCYDYPNDRVTSELTATVRRGDKVLSNGRLVSVREDEAAGTSTWHWAQERPHAPYLITMTVGPYEILEDRAGGLPVNYWVYPRDVSNARRSFEKTPEMIEFFSRTFGFDYPWAKYDQVTIAGWGGGLENTTATVLGHGTLHDERAEQDFSSHGLVAHELAHMWWGDCVTERTWSHVWLSESFATYSEYLFQRFDKGEDEGAVNLLEKKNSYLREARTRYMRPLVFDRYNGPWDIMDAHAYPKGACILHMLRFVMGDKPFFRTLAHFLDTHAYQAVDTHDFQIAVKQASGRNLDWFFDQWVFRAGHPVFEVSREWEETAGRLLLRVTQVQDTSRGVPIHRTPVNIGIVTAGGRTSHRVWLEKAEERFEFPAETEPLMVRFDEGNFLLKQWTFEKSLAELLYQLEHDDVIGRMWAAERLESFGDRPAAAAALERSARRDPFWHVRLNSLLALSSSCGSSPKETLFKDLAKDSSSRVRAAALRALGENGRAHLAEYFQRRFREDDSYLAQAEALRALGRCGDSGVLPFLERAGRTTSPRRVLRRAADEAIKRLSGEGNQTADSGRRPDRPAGKRVPPPGA